MTEPTKPDEPSTSTEPTKPKGVEAFRAEIQTKIKALLLEFSSGNISNAQFNILYERYSSQLALTYSFDQAAELASPDMNTIAIREATAPKAIGLSVYHHPSGTMIETLGQFELPSSLIAAQLNEIGDKLERHEFVPPIVKQAAGGFYIAYLARSVTTVITLFRNEPAPAQLRDLERIHHDFEEANRHLLAQSGVDAAKLARPFLVFIQRKRAGE